MSDTEAKLYEDFRKMQEQVFKLSLSVAALSQANLNLQKSVLNLTNAMKEIIQLNEKEHNPKR